MAHGWLVSGAVNATRTWFTILPALLLVTGCASWPWRGDANGLAEAQGSASEAHALTREASKTWVLSDWHHQTFPGKNATSYINVRDGERDAIQSVAQSSASALRHKLYLPGGQLGHLNFSWKVPALIANADMALRDADDSPVRLVLVFDGDRSKFSLKNAMLSELAQAMTGEPMPYATLMYVWCNTRAPGSMIINPRTDRIRKLVVESGEGRLNQWLDYRRDIAADFEQAFGEAPGALIGVGIMTDTDNTRSKAQAWYGPVTLTKR
jgi:hypothetical protein